MENKHSRRKFLASLAGITAATFLGPLGSLMAAERDKVKITDIKTMVLQGPTTQYMKGRTHIFVKVETDAGLYGIAEAYGSPGLGVKEAIHGIKKMFIGKDPLQIDRLYTGYRYTDGSAHAQQRAMSGIEMALWDVAGKILDVPTHTLLGGKFRDKVRMYDHHVPLHYNDKASCRDWAAEAKSRANGITIHKLAAPLLDEADDFGYDPSNRHISSKGMSKLIKGYENVREAIG